MKGRQIKYEPEELAWIEARKEWPRKDLHVAFCNFWQRADVSFDNFKALCTRKGWKTGRTGAFTPAHVPHNKGRKGYCAPGSEKGHFAKGNKPHTYRGPGHETICPKDGYVYMIVAETNPHTGADTRRVLKHKWIWEQANGPLPEGHALKCLDGDRTNTNPANWVAVPRAMLPRLAGAKGRMGYDTAAPELRPTLLAIARVEHAVREAKP